MANLMPDMRLPNSKQRLAVIGRTGSGKTQAAVWHLSQQAIESKPWLIIDFKTDELINSIDRANHIELGEVPKKPGVYICHPLPSEMEELEAYLWKIWAKENIGVYIDEGYMMENNKAFEACLTQGRSKRIPMIVLTQRPVWLSRFVFSESDFFQVFHLNDKRDRKTIEGFLPSDVSRRLPDYHSHYYDVGRNALHRLAPVPGADTILETFDDRLRPPRKFV